MTRRPPPLLITGFGALAVAATAATVWASATSTVHASPGLASAVRGLLITTWAFVGLVTWERRPDSRLGPLIGMTVVALTLTGLTAFESPGLFTLGAMAWPVQTLLVIAVVLAVPDARLQGRTSRLILAATAVAAALPWGLLLAGAASIPTVPGQNHCEADCPTNPLAFLDFSASLTDVVEAAGVMVFTVAAAAVAAVLVARWRAATPAWRHAMRPAVVVLLALAGTFVIATSLRAALGADDDLVEAALWAPPLASVAFPLALLVVQSRARLFAAGALREMVGRLSPGASHRDLEATIASALGDPSLKLVFWVERAGYVDLAGHRVEVSDPDSTLTRICDDDEVVAAILHDPILEQPVPGVVEDAGTAVLLALENARLEAEVRTAERQLRESRARILAAGMNERRRMERDLHDTAQQRLMMLRVKLDMAEQSERIPSEEVRSLLERLGREVEETIGSLRQVGHGLYPPVLGERGLVAALRAELGSDRPAGLVTRDVGRSRTDLESAVYLSCREALAAVAEEAGDTADVDLELEARGPWLRIHLTGEADGIGPGLAERVAARMRDPVAALGGRADASGATTPWSVTAYVPWPPVAEGAAG